MYSEYRLQNSASTLETSTLVLGLHSYNSRVTENCSPIYIFVKKTNTRTFLWAQVYIHTKSTSIHSCTYNRSMNTSQYMDKQIMDLTNSQTLNTDFINLNPQRHLDEDDDGDYKKEEIVPNYDFQPIRSTTATDSTPPRVWTSADSKINSAVSRVTSLSLSVCVCASISLSLCNISISDNLNVCIYVYSTCMYIVFYLGCGFMC